MSATEVHWR